MTMETLYRSSEIRIPENVEESRTVQFRISDASRDRHGTVLNMDNWNLENYNRNGIVGYQHDVYGGGLCEGPNPDSVIGKGRAWIEQNGMRDNGASDTVLMGEVEFEPADINPLAEKVFQKVKHGTLKATSVGFRSLGGGKLVNEETGQEKEMDRAPYSIGPNETFYFNGQELLEFSVVNIPSNPNALKKELRGQTASALQFIRRELGLSYGAIEKMRVIDVLEMLENPDRREELKETIFTLDGEQVAKSTGQKETDESQSAVRDGLRSIQLRKIQLKKQAININ